MFGPFLCRAAKNGTHRTTKYGSYHFSCAPRTELKHERFLVCIAIVCALMVPLSVDAAVVINEVAWMGTSVSANDEWIELYNNGSSPTALDDWVFSDNASLSVTLSGTIPAGGYAVLERTDDSSASGAAFLMYTGALSNSGGTLTLKRSDGGIEDQVAGGENWENIGGDNATKETAQRTVGGWITANATPGAQNASIGSTNIGNEEDTEVDGETAQTATSGAADSPQSPVKTLRMLAPKTAFVHQPVPFDVVPGGSGDRLVRYFWNFGDGNLEEAKDPIHAFTHAGEYVVIVESRFLGEEAMARQTITVLPAMLSLARTELGAVQVHNNAKYEIDLGKFMLRGEKEFVIPENTILLPNATLTVHRSLIETGPRKLVSLHDPAGVTLASILAHETSSIQKEKETVPLGELITVSTPKPALEIEEVSVLPEPTEAYENPVEPLVYRPAQIATVEESEDSPLKDMIPYLGLIGVLGVGILGVYARRNTTEASAEL